MSDFLMSIVILILIKCVYVFEEKSVLNSPVLKWSLDTDPGKQTVSVSYGPHSPTDSSHELTESHKFSPLVFYQSHNRSLKNVPHLNKIVCLWSGSTESTLAKNFRMRPVLKQTLQVFNGMREKNMTGMDKLDIDRKKNQHKSSLNMAQLQSAVFQKRHPYEPPLLPGASLRSELQIHERAVRFVQEMDNRLLKQLLAHFGAVHKSQDVDLVAIFFGSHHSPVSTRLKLSSQQTYRADKSNYVLCHMLRMILKLCRKWDSYCTMRYPISKKTTDIGLRLLDVSTPQSTFALLVVSRDAFNTSSRSLFRTSDSLPENNYNPGKEKPSKSIVRKMLDAENGKSSGDTGLTYIRVIGKLLDNPWISKIAHSHVDSLDFKRRLDNINTDISMSMNESKRFLENNSDDKTTNGNIPQYDYEKTNSSKIITSENPVTRTLTENFDQKSSINKTVIEVNSPESFLATIFFGSFLKGSSDRETFTRAFSRDTSSLKLGPKRYVNLSTEIPLVATFIEHQSSNISMDSHLTENVSSENAVDMTLKEGNGIPRIGRIRRGALNMLRKALAMVKAKTNLRCLGLFIGGHKYFGFDSRRGNFISWKYRAKGFHSAFPRPRLKKLHSQVEEFCSTGFLNCVSKLSAVVMKSTILKNASCAEQSQKKRPEDVGPYYPFSSPIDLFRFRTTAMYYLCWHVLKRPEMARLLRMDANSRCVEGLENNEEPLGNQKRILDYRKNDRNFECALALFCPDPCYGRKTQGRIPNLHFVLYQDPGNPCRELKDKRCEWRFDDNRSFRDLQRNRFNISCQCQNERKGFSWDSKYHICVDVDECQQKEVREKCGQNKRCQNTVGGYECLCRPGYLRDVNTQQCQEHMKLPQPALNQSLLDARRLRKMLRKEGSGAFLERQLEVVLGLSSATCLTRPCCYCMHVYDVVSVIFLFVVKD